MAHNVCVYLGAGLAAYAFGEEHPFGPRRHAAFEQALLSRGLERQVHRCQPRSASQDEIELFHSHGYVEQVRAQSQTGAGYLDRGDTPAFKGVYEAAATVVGTTLDALARVMAGECRRAFVPIAGLHHARRDAAAGFCVFNDVGVAIEALRRRYGVQRVAYVDIDAHHGDGVFYAFERDPGVYIVDLHEDGRFLYPGTGFAEETGRDDAMGSKLNIPMPMYADDAMFVAAWRQAEAFLDAARPEFILLQCGADSLAGDPVTQLRYSEAAHRLATKSLCAIAEKHAGGRMLALGGGGYNLDNLGRAWCAVVESLLE